MRTLKLQIQLSIDGCIAGPNGEMDWMTWDWDEALKQQVDELHQTVDTIIMGLSFSEGFIPHWKKVAQQADHPEKAFGQFIMDTEKVIFTRSPNRGQKINADWPYAHLSDDSLKDGLLNMKQKSGGDIIVYGGSQFVSSLLRESLIDELNLFINPVALGKGIPIFHQLSERQNYEVDLVRKFDCGIVLLRYKKQDS
jgi:dihydrofolate reductase